MDDKRVRAIDEIVFEQTDPPTVLKRGSLYSVEAVLEGGVILYTGDERFMEPPPTQMMAFLPFRPFRFSRAPLPK